MTRRALLLSIPNAVLDNPYNRMATAGNEFIAVWELWAKEINGIDYKSHEFSVRAFDLGQEMDRRYRTYQKKRREWEQGRTNTIGG